MSKLQDLNEVVVSEALNWLINTPTSAPPQLELTHGHLSHRTSTGTNSRLLTLQNSTLKTKIYLRQENHRPSKIPD